jgi:hypothetical protein
MGGTAASWLPLITPVLIASSAGVELGYRAFPGRRTWAGPVLCGLVAGTNPWIVARVAAGQIGVALGYAFSVACAAALVQILTRRHITVRSAVNVTVWWAAAAAASIHFTAVTGIGIVICWWIVRRYDTRDADPLFLAAGSGTVAATALWWIAAGTHNLAGGSGGSAAAEMFTTSGGPITLPFHLLTGGGFWRPADNLPWTVTAIGAAIIILFGWAVVHSWKAGKGTTFPVRSWVVGVVAAAALIGAAGRGPSAAVWNTAHDHIGILGLWREPGKFLIWAPIAAGICGAWWIAQQRPLTQIVAAGVATLTVAGTWMQVTSAAPGVTLPDGWSAAVRETDAAGGVTDACQLVAAGDWAYITFNNTWIAHPAPGLFGDGTVISGNSGNSRLPVRASSDAQRWANQIVTDRTNPAVLEQLITPQAAADVDVGWVFIGDLTLRAAIVEQLNRNNFERVSDHLWRRPGGC